MPQNLWTYSQSHVFITEESVAEPFSEGYIQANFAPQLQSLTQWWEAKEGLVLFLRARATDLDLDILSGKLREFLRNPQHRQVRLLWVENPGAPLVEWKTNSLSFAKDEGGTVVTQLSYLNLRNYAFSIAAGTRMALDQPQSPTGLVLSRAQQNPFAFELSTGFGHTRLYEIGDEVRIPLQSPDSGCVQFDFWVNKAGDQEGSFGYPALTSLDAGLRLFFRDPDFPEQGDRFYLASHRYPVVQEAFTHPNGFSYFPPKISFRVSLDPIYPLASARTHFTFQPLEGKFAQTGIPTAYRTNLGYSVHLIPQANQARLQFALRPANTQESEKTVAPFYLAPAGDFEIQVPRYLADGSVSLIPAASMVCGLSGVEYIKVGASPASILTFEPDQPGFAPSFVSVSSLLRDLPTIIESFSQRTLPPNTRDLDIRIEDKEEGEAEESMGITDTERRAILNLVRDNYFPVGFTFTTSQLEEYDGLEYIEELINWLQDSLQNAGAGEANLGGALAAAPVTSWVYIRNGSGSVYFAQPDQAVLYKAESSSRAFLDYLEIPSVGLPDTVTVPQISALADASGFPAIAFPMMPYGNVAQDLISDIRALELALINNYRRNRIQKISDATAHITSLKATGSEGPTGTTPQGLIAKFSPDCRTIEQLRLARDTKNKVIPFVGIEHGSPLKAALQSNQLFMAISKPDAVAQYFSSEALAAIPGAGNAIDIQNWIFELGTEHWSKRGTILIFKFHDKPLLELAGNPDFWSFPDQFNQDKAQISRSLVRLLKEAVAIGNGADPKARRKYEVLARAATQANWTGILALNVDVPLRNLPNELKALAAGMNPDLFYGQYLGVEVTQVTSTGTELLSQQSSLFGLIDYSNPQVPQADPSGYNFHVPSLTVVFQNAQIADFGAEVLIVMDKLFDEATTLYQSPDGTNTLRLQGVAEEHNGKITYSFGFSGANHFLLSGNVLEDVEIYKAQFVTDPLPSGNPDPLPVNGRFFFWTRMRFAYQSAFDILSFGSNPGTGILPAPKPGEEPLPPDYLSASNLQIVMSFNLYQAANETRDLSFAFNPNQMAFDLERSGWRKQSLYEKFPLKFSGFRYVNGDPAAFGNSGFMPVSNPLGTATLDDTWYGITFELNLGSVGALAGSAGLVVSILAAWSPEKEGVFIGLKLPGSSGGKKEITIQGLLKIVFKKIQFVVYPLDPNEDLANLPTDTEREVGYLLKIKNIVLKFFSVSFPPTGQTELILFGDPRDEVEREDKLLGWYGAYAR